MKKNIEKNIRYKAIFLYASALISVLVMIFYINDLRREMVEHKQNINSQNDLLFMTNELVFSVSEAQSQSGANSLRVADGTMVLMPASLTGM